MNLNERERMKLTEQQEHEAGERLADALRLRKSGIDERYRIEGGSKTERGLFLAVELMVETLRATKGKELW
jgi:hypothetical protein